MLVVGLSAFASRRGQSNDGCKVLWSACIPFCPLPYLKTAYPNFTKFF